MELRFMDLGVLAGQISSFSVGLVLAYRREPKNIFSLLSTVFLN